MNKQDRLVNLMNLNTPEATYNEVQLLINYINEELRQTNIYVKLQNYFEGEYILVDTKNGYNRVHVDSKAYCNRHNLKHVTFDFSEKIFAGTPFIPAERRFVNVITKLLTPFGGQLFE